jgi:alpha-tubulin suppressor-like RCC1 family protein
MRSDATAAALLLPFLLMLAGCERGGSIHAESPEILHVEGVVESDIDGPMAGVEVLLRIFRPDGAGGWSEAETDPAGRYAMEVLLRDGCDAGTSLQTAATVRIPDHRWIVEDLGGGTRSLQCRSAPQVADYTLYRTIFRAPQPVAGGLAATRLSAGTHTCAIASDGAYCWGPSTHGTLGNPEAGDLAPAPVPVAGGESFRHIVVGHYHACALDGEGAAWCWGSNATGALGVPDLESAEVPVMVETGVRFEQLAANLEGTCGITSDGDLYCWGMYGEAAPSRFGDGARFTQISGSNRHMCGVTGDGDVYCWGLMDEWVPSGRAEAPVRVPGIGDMVAVSAGDAFTCALRSTGGAYCWGANWEGQLGNGNASVRSIDTPTPVVGGQSFTAISAGRGATCGLTGDGEAWCWGRHAAAGISDGGCPDGAGAQTWCSVPARFGGDIRFTEIEAGPANVCGIATGGELYCWGAREHLGTGLPIE